MEAITFDIIAVEMFIFVASPRKKNGNGRGVFYPKIKSLKTGNVVHSLLVLFRLLRKVIVTPVIHLSIISSFTSFFKLQRFHTACC